MTEQEIRDLFKTKNVPLDAKDVWRVQQALVIKHAALERLAAEIGITFDKPEVLRAEADECVLLVHGKLGEAQEWSIGEAKIGLNYQVSGKQAGYPYAMSEKRAKDRVILKLAKLHGAYSEDEADDFKQSASVTHAPVSRPTEEGDASTALTLVAALKMAKSVPELEQWSKDNGKTIAALPEALKASVRAAYGEHRLFLLTTAYTKKDQAA